MKTIMNKRNVCLGLVAFACMLTTDLSAQASYGWRGPHRDGIYQEMGLLKQWPAAGPTQLWEVVDAGKGYSSPVVYEGKVYITGMNEDGTKEIFSAYTTAGKKVYSIVYGNPWNDSYPETRTTPTIDGNHAFVISGSGEVVCINLADGKIIWKEDAGTKYGHEVGHWGTAESPLIYDGKVIYTPSGKQTTMVALNESNGSLVWKSPSLGDQGAYVSPILITYKGKRQIIGSTGVNLIGVDPETGAIEWKFDNWGKGGWGGGKIAPNTPIFKDGFIFFSQGYDAGAFKLQLADDLKSVKLVWSNSDLDTHVGAYVLINNVVYGSNHITNTDGHWLEVDWNTGKTLYDQAWTGGKSKGSIISADGLLYCYDERRGAVGLVRPNPAKFDVISEFRITKGEGPYWAHPVISDGVLYIRHGNFLGAYKIK